MIRYHPSLEILEAYARGALNAGSALVVACHVHGCAVCRSEAAILEDAGGAFLQDTTPAAVSGDALERIFTRIDDVPPPSARVKAPGFLERFSVPAPLRRQRVGFRRWVTPNIWFAPVHVRPKPEALTYLVYAGKNTTLARHTHRGQEFTSVLYGRFSDESGAFGPGDFAQTDESVEHAPAVMSDSECLCLISADAPMQLLGLPARIIQTMTGSLY
ncbi:MAG: ChrR family anti-sigma-E factor [Alphaproteobacteria bacterium]|nr:ChrR family anti-sigma-E factor [Alphaproteobacteria bacterium]MDE1986460.1 ChrR family anti-sigma-E factor [Alphaproteobacteria bacterium]MDE2163828.1 ChrR family anti-sigma-E factor [Alphaproteobacteria bacterium]MDE2265765.1 ChrR family anti-sigma-E factor [Alphaproteobacteria bacterium]MDE2498847.1 ChrR family anti-sigma-E factor [Alphaproteobacteria bacterium]